jgi:D-tyrosyl-tRNA(Tyr) deacylase
MRAVIQRVLHASVRIDGSIVSEIGKGLLVLVAVAPADREEDAVWLAGKTARMRIFSDHAGLMNLAVGEAGGGILAVSQFTLLASTRKGNRPSHTGAAAPDTALPLFEAFCAALAAATTGPVRTGVFGADMQVSLTNDGPVTIVIDSRLRE